MRALSADQAGSDRRLDSRRDSFAQCASAAMRMTNHLVQRRENWSYRQRCPQLLWIQTDPAFDFLHQDARYQSLIRQLGLPPSY
jgi:hypothetical protein